MLSDLLLYIVKEKRGLRLHEGRIVRATRETGLMVADVAGSLVLPFSWFSGITQTPLYNYKGQTFAEAMASYTLQQHTYNLVYP